MKIISFSPKGWEANSYLVINGGQGALIDAGAPTKSVLEALQSQQAELKYVLLTHGHFDHTITANAICEATGAKLAICEADAEMLQDPEKSALALFLGRRDTVKQADILLENGNEIDLGGIALRVIHTPGHSKGSVCYLAGNALFTGDTLFNGGYGRYDLYGGDFNSLCASLSFLKELDGKLEIFPGHGDTATLETALNYLNFI